MESALSSRAIGRKWIFVLMLILFFCIIADATAEGIVRSSSLKEVITQDGNVRRIDYVNEQGDVTFAADKQYATVIITTFDDSQIVEYFDADGNPAKQRMGHYALHQELDEDGRIWKSTFLGIDEEPIICSNGYASYIRTFYENGNVRTEHYYDKQGSPVNTGAYGYGCRKEYDELNRNTVLVYLGDDDHPVMTPQGFAIVHRSFYENGEFEGFVRDEYYFDANEEPVILRQGQSGVRKGYDQFGRDALLTYLDANGDPIITKEGYTTVKRTFYADDTVETEMYFDSKGNPVSLSEGQYGIRYNTDRTQVFLDVSGRVQINIKKLLYNSKIIVVISAVIIIFISAITGRRMNIVLLAAYGFAVIYMTLLYRISVTPDQYSLLLSSYGGFFSGKVDLDGIFNNILLFLPLGAILYRLYPKAIILLIPVLFSSIIEVYQYISRTGFCELIDILSNSTGSILGYAAGKTIARIMDLHERKNRSEK